MTKGLLRASLVVAATTALLAACSATLTPESRRADGQALLRRMAERLATAQAISLKTDQEIERVAQDGTKHMERASVEITLRRPDRFWFRASGDRGLEGFFDGERVTLISHGEKVYGEIPTPSTIDEAVDVLSDRFDVPMPVADLLTRRPDEVLLTPKTTGGWDGEEDVDGTRCARLVWQHPNVDWSIWIATSGEPLPCKLHISYKSRRGQPTATVRFREWNLAATVTDETFARKIPADFEGIAIIQRVSRVLERQPTTNPPPNK
jgi:hypothetical protein